MNKIIEQIIEWGNDKGINNPDKQFQKLAEEMLEAHEAYIEKEVRFVSKLLDSVEIERLENHLIEELGDIGVVWVLLCDMFSISPSEALRMAHTKNKDRKGKTINDNFIKESDL